MNHQQKRSGSRLAMFNLRRMADRKSDWPQHILTAAVRPCAESLERRMLLSVSASMVADINVSTADSTPYLLGDLGNGKAVMYADDGFHGFEPFVTDGTAAGTTLLKDINPGPANSTPPGTIMSTYSTNPVVANGRFFSMQTMAFTATSSGSRTEHPPAQRFSKISIPAVPAPARGRW